ncbi:MAG: SH3 domain-containing protein, partial [Saprospiraceae bacterium]
PPPPPAESAGTVQKYPTLYVTIDGLNMRKAPSKKSALVARLHLHEQVLFLNKKSEKPEEINLGLEKVTDYWVNIQTKSGLEGWVFGAGVHYYKIKRKGVAE